MEYVQSRLRSASDIYKQGGHVTPVYRDQLFRMHYDNRRLIVEPEKPADFDNFNNCLLDSKPVRNVNEALNLRFISKISKAGLYSKQTRGGGVSNTYKTYEDLAVRNFLKGLLADPPKFNLNRDDLNSQKKILEFLESYHPSIKYTLSGLSNLRNRPIKWKSVPQTPQTDAFINYVKAKFKEFDVTAFYRSS